MDEQVIEDRESVMNFLRKVASEAGFESVFIVGRTGDKVDALWYGDHLPIYTMACLGKRAIWETITGEREAETTDIGGDVPIDWNPSLADVDNDENCQKT